MSERITVEISDGIADVRLNRGDKMNAMDGPMFKALIETADELAKTKGLRAVVLSGNGPAWCAGLDFSGFQSMAGGGESNTSSIGEMENDRITHNAQQACGAGVSCRCPSSPPCRRRLRCRYPARRRLRHPLRRP